MKNFLTALFTLILFATTASVEASPVRIVRLPIIFQSTAPDTDTAAELEVKISRAVHIPLNGTLQLADYVPTKDSTMAMNDIWQDLRAENKKAKIVDAIKPLSEKLNADLIICPILKQYSQYISPFGMDENYMTSQVLVELIVYDRRTDELIDKRASQFYHDSYHMMGTASSLAKICFDNVIEKTKLRQRIMAIR